VSWAPRLKSFVYSVTSGKPHKFYEEHRKVTDLLYYRSLEEQVHASCIGFSVRAVAGSFNVVAKQNPWLKVLGAFARILDGFSPSVGIRNECLHLPGTDCTCRLKYEFLEDYSFTICAKSYKTDVAFAIQYLELGFKLDDGVIRPSLPMQMDIHHAPHPHVLAENQGPLEVASSERAASGKWNYRLKYYPDQGLPRERDKPSYADFRRPKPGDRVGLDGVPSAQVSHFFDGIGVPGNAPVGFIAPQQALHFDYGE